MAETVQCCPSPRFEAQVDWGARTGSARNFLERHGIIPARRHPKPRIEPDAFRVHQSPLKPPLPLPDLLQHLNGEPPPDRAVTGQWPHSSSTDEA